MNNITKMLMKNLKLNYIDVNMKNIILMDYQYLKIFKLMILHQIVLKYHGI